MRLLTEVIPVKHKPRVDTHSMKGEYDVTTMGGMSRFLALKFGMYEDDVMRLLTEFFRALDREVITHKATFHVPHFGTFVSKSRPHPNGNREFVSVIRRYTGKSNVAGREESYRYTDVEDPEDAGPSKAPAPATQRLAYHQGGFNGLPHEGDAPAGKVPEDERFFARAPDDVPLEYEDVAVTRAKCDVPRARAKRR